MSIFGRRSPLSLMQRLKEAVWPRQGITRTMHYYRHRLTRLPGTSHSIAAGIAAGVSMSFMPLGIHVPLSVGLALLLRGSPIAAALSTIVIGNPFVSGLLMAADLGLGEFLVGRHRATSIGADISIFEALRHPMVMLEKYGLPYMVGALVLASIAGVVGYFLARRMVKIAHAARARRLRRRWRRVHGGAHG